MAVLGLLGAALWTLRQKPAPDASRPTVERTHSEPLAAGSSNPAASTALIPSTNALLPLLESVLTGNSAEERRRHLGEVRRWLRDTPAEVRRAQLAAFLASRRDADLGGQFKVGADGSLTTSPTLRVWLLNEFSGMDRAEAAALAREVLSRPDSADEWAVALRCLALGDTSAAAHALLKEKTLALLQREAWQEQASSGFLQAFDVAVYLRDAEFAPVLSGLLRQTNQVAVAHAAFLALDRLVLAAPVESLRELQANPDWLAGREGTRAGIFARADVTDASQRTILETYLLDSRRSPGELSAFAATFPNASLFLSPNLLTRQATFDGATLLRRDIATLQVVRGWLGEPRFAPVREALRLIESRLAEYVSQAGR